MDNELTRVEILQSNIDAALLKLTDGQPGEVQQRLIDLIEQAGSDVDRYFVSLHSGARLVEMGRWAEARELLTRSAQVALRLSGDSPVARSHEKLGDLAAAEGNWFGARHHYRYALRNAPASDRSLTDALEAKAHAAWVTLHSTILVQDPNIVSLSREYVSGNIAIAFVHRDIFRMSYFARCLECSFCHDWCCSFGADIDIQNVEKILQHREGILQFVRPPEGEWFEPDYSYYEEYTGNLYTRINPQGPRCAFISRDQRGCGLHRYALSRGMDYHEIKPLVCSLFPLSFGEGVLTIAPELEDNSLVCAGAGESVYRSLREEIEFYFGRELAEELDAIARKISGDDPF